MSQQIIYSGLSITTEGLVGDTTKSAFDKINSNFTKLYGSSIPSGAANLILATPNGSSGTATLTNLLIADISGLGSGWAAALAATYSAGGGSGIVTSVTDTDTFDGYTLKQIVKALRNIGLLQ